MADPFTPRPLLVLASSTGGVGRHVAALAEAFAGQGVKVTVAGPAATEERFRFTGLGAGFIPVEIAAEPRPGPDAAAVRAIAAAAVAVDATVVHAHGLRAGAAAVLARKAAHATDAVAGVVGRGHGARRTLVVSLHNAVLATGPKGRILGGLERLVARGADVVLGASEDLVDRARALGARDARPGPVAAPEFREAGRDWAEVRAELGAAGRPLLLAVGRLAPQKDYPLLLSAAVEWSRLDPPPLLVIAGDGPLRGDLQARIDAGGLPVRLLGDRGDVPDLLAAADLVVLSSRWEARALIAQEALRAGTPLVATAVGGVPELVGAAARLVPHGDPSAFAAAVADLLASPAAAGRLAAAGLVRAAAWPTEADVAASVLGLYAELAGREPGAAKVPG